MTEVAKRVDVEISGMHCSSCAGLIENGILKCAPNLAIQGVNLKKILQKKFILKVVGDYAWEQFQNKIGSFTHFQRFEKINKMSDDFRQMPNRAET